MTAVPRRDGIETAVERAMRTIAARGRESTVVDVVHGRVLRQYAPSIERYLMLRLADTARARLAMRELRATVATAESNDFVAPPSVRAHLFRLARRIAGHHRHGSILAATARAGLPWAFGASGRGDGPLLDRIRTALDEGSLELLELRHVRGLSVEEVACVVDLPLSDVLACADVGLDSLRKLIRAQGHDDSAFAAILDEALALDLTDGTPVGDDTAPLVAGTVIGGRYALDRRVGAGAFGEVYCASDTEVPGHRVALKLLYQPSTSPEARFAALRELHLIASVFHPSIVQFKDHGWHENRLWFVMPWYEGETLEARMRRGPLSRAEAHAIFPALAHALAAMHAATIRHQDVKPDNVFLARIASTAEDDVLPVLLDLGVAAKEAEMIVAGTPTYFAPEVAAQFASADDRPAIGPRADVFSLALTLRNALEPEREDTIGNGVEVFVAHRASEDLPGPSREDLRFLRPHFARWLARDPDKRPDAATFARELDVLLEPEQKRARRRAMLTVAIPLAIAVFSILGAFGVVAAARVRAERQERERIAARAEVLASELGATRGDKARADRALARAESQLERGRLSSAELERTIATVRAALDGAVARMDALESRAMLAERDLASAERKVAEAERARDAESSRTATLTRDLASRSAELDRDRAALADLRTRHEALARELDRARVEVARAEDTAAASEIRAETLASRLDDAGSRINRLEQELENARLRARQLERDIERNRPAESSIPAAAP